MYYRHALGWGATLQLAAAHLFRKKSSPTLPSVSGLHCGQNSLDCSKRQVRGMEVGRTLALMRFFESLWLVTLKAHDCVNNRLRFWLVHPYFCFGFYFILFVFCVLEWMCVMNVCERSWWITDIFMRFYDLKSWYRLWYFDRPASWHLSSFGVAPPVQNHRRLIGFLHCHVMGQN